MEYTSDMTPAEMAAAVRKLKAERSRIEQHVKEMKAMEADLEGRILMYLDIQGTDSVRFSGIGTFSKRKDKKVYIKDVTKLAQYVERAMQEARKNGTPLVDALSVLQTRAAKANLLELVEMGMSEEELGITIKEEVSLSINSKGV